MQEQDIYLPLMLESILQGIKKNPDISHIEKKNHVCIPRGFIVKKANVTYI